MPGVRPLTLTKAPRGAGAISSAAVGRAYAGPFSDLRATGAMSARGAADARHAPLHARLDPDELDRDPAVRQRAATPPTCCSRAAGGRARVGRRGAARRLARDGRLEADPARVGRVPVGAQRAQRLRRRAPVTRPAGAGVHVIRAVAQSSDPKPGPTAAIQIARAQRFSRAALTVRLTPVHDEQEAAAAAARLK